MTVVEKAAYLKGLVEGLGIEPDSREGKLWGALGELLSDMAHEIEDLQATDMDHAEALDEMAEELSYLEDLVCDLDEPEDFDDEDCDGDCDSCGLCDEDLDEDEEDEDGEEELISYECPSCGHEIVFKASSVDFDEDYRCPACGKPVFPEIDEDDDPDGDKE